MSIIAANKAKMLYELIGSDIRKYDEYNQAIIRRETLEHWEVRLREIIDMLEDTYDCTCRPRITADGLDEDTCNVHVERYTDEIPY